MDALDLEELERQSVITSLKVLDTAEEWQFDCLTALASHIMKAPIAALSLVDQNRVWFKSKINLSMDHVDRNDSFCAWSIKTTEPTVLTNLSKDPRFHSHPYVVGPPNLKFYAGVPLNVRGLNIGTLCVMDRRELQPSEYDLAALALLANLASEMLVVRSETEESERLLKQVIKKLQVTELKLSKAC